MENASKALIIAGAILIAILLISVGIIVMNSINKPIDQATSQAESQAVEMFNSKFTGYAGDQKSSAVKALLTSIGSSQTSSEGKALANSIKFDSTTTTVGVAQGKVVSGKTYNVSFTYATEGYINGVEITTKELISS